MGKDMKRADQDYALADLIVIASQVLGTMRKTDLVPYEITPEASRVLTAIQTLGNKATSAAISRSVFRKPNSVSEILSRMQKKGLIKRERQGKGRSQIIVLTDKGQKVYEAIDAIKMQSLGYITSFMSNAQEQQLLVSLEELLRRAFQKLGIELPSRFS